MLKRQSLNKLASLFVAMLILCGIFTLPLAVSADGLGDVAVKFGEWTLPGGGKNVEPVLESSFQGERDVFVLKNMAPNAQATDPWVNYLFSNNSLATNGEKYTINFDMYLSSTELNADHGLRFRFITSTATYLTNINFRPNGNIGLDGASSSSLAVSAFTPNAWQAVEIEVNPAEAKWSVKIGGVSKVSAQVLPGSLVSGIHGISLAPVYNSLGGNAIFAMNNFRVTNETPTNPVEAKFGKWAKATSSAGKVITPVLESSFQGKNDVFILKNTTNEAQATDPWTNYLFLNNSLATNMQKFKVNFDMYLKPDELNAEHGLRFRFINTNGDTSGSGAYGSNINFRPNGDIGLDGMSLLATDAFTTNTWQTVEIEVCRVEKSYSIKIGGVEKVSATAFAGNLNDIYGISLAPVYTNRNGNAVFAMDNFSVTELQYVAPTNPIEDKFGKWTLPGGGKNIEPVLESSFQGKSDVFVLKNTTTAAQATDPWVNYLFANNSLATNMQRFKINFNMYLSPAELNTDHGIRFRFMNSATTSNFILNFLPNGDMKKDSTGGVIATGAFTPNAWQAVELEVCRTEMVWILKIGGVKKASGSLANTDIHGININPIYTNRDGNAIFAMDNFNITELPYGNAVKYFVENEPTNDPNKADEIRVAVNGVNSTVILAEYSITNKSLKNVKIGSNGDILILTRLTSDSKVKLLGWKDLVNLQPIASTTLELKPIVQ